MLKKQLLVLAKEGPFFPIMNRGTKIVPHWRSVLQTKIRDSELSAKYIFFFHLHDFVVFDILKFK